MAVSYTHLELLEEQLEDSVLILQEDRGDDFTVLAAVTLSEDEDEEGEPCFADQVKIIGLNGNLEPVSYTHLDVYKRQLL